MFSRIQGLRDIQLNCDQLSIREEELNLGGVIHELEKDNHVPTSMIDSTEEPSLIPRSFKNKPGDFEISFEQNFLSEHIKAFSQKIKNFIELSLKASSENGLDFATLEVFGLQMDKEPLDINQISYLSPKQRKQFMVDLSYEENLKKFLQKLAQDFPKPIVDELVYYAYLAWEKYISIAKPGLNQKQLLRRSSSYALEVAQYNFDKHTLPCLNYKAFDPEILESPQILHQNFKEFMEFYLNTVFLIIEGYFENPQYRLQEGKRSRPYDYSEEEQSILNFSSEFQISYGMPIKRSKLE